MKINCNLGFFGLLTIAFIVLKLCGVVAWSWWLVLAPILVPVLIIFVFIAIWIWANSGRRW